METKSTGPKLSGKKEKYRLEICKMLAMGYTPSLVAQEMKDLYDIIISRQVINDTYKNGKRRFIEQLRTRLAKDIMKHPLADKRVRLNYLKRALQHALTWGTDKLYFDKDGNLVGKVEKVQLGVIAQIIREAREEIEGLQKTGGDAEGRIPLTQIIKILSNGKATIIENRFGDSAPEAVGVDQPRARNYQVL